MRRIVGRSALLGVAFALVLTACSGDDTTETTVTTLAPDATTTTTVPVVIETTTTSSTEATTTTTLPPTGPPLAVEGDKNDVVAAIQFLLNCGSYGDLTEDGSFGPATRTAVEAAQTSLGLPVNGLPDDELFAALSQACPQDRRLPGDDGSSTVIGSASVGAPATFPIALVFGTTLTVEVLSGEGIAFLVRTADGVPVESEDGAVFDIPTTGEYVIQVDVVPDPLGGEPEPVTFTLGVKVARGEQEDADWLITTSGIAYRGTKLSLGDPAAATITKIFEYLGHGVRGGNSGEYDTGWDFPGQEGFRGIVIEGFRFLFTGPNTEFPDRAETFARVRVVAPTTDANGDPRPAFYVTTPEGIGVGNSLVDLKTAYDDAVRAGGTERNYYRLVNSRGEICFYFGDAGDPTPTDASAITEISTECRG